MFFTSWTTSACLYVLSPVRVVEVKGSDEEVGLSIINKMYQEELLLHAVIPSTPRVDCLWLWAERKVIQRLGSFY